MEPQTRRGRAGRCKTGRRVRIAGLDRGAGGRPYARLYLIARRAYGWISSCCGGRRDKCVRARSRLRRDLRVEQEREPKRPITPFTRGERDKRGRVERCLQGWK